MTRFIFSLLMLLLVLLRPLPAKNTKGSARAETAEQNLVPSAGSSSKRTISLCAPIQHAAEVVKKVAEAGEAALGSHLARLTAYWSGEDYYTRHHMSATGIRLHQGHCAVDPSVIPYGSVVEIEGLGKYLAVDTGTAVVSRRAAREAGKNRGERNALVIDLFFEHRSDGENFAATGPKYASISWSTPGGDNDIASSSPVLKDVAYTAPAPLPEPKVAATRPVPRRDSKVAAVKPLSTTKIAATKTLSKPATRTASAKSIQKTETVSAKPVPKHDTQNTAIASSKPKTKGATKFAALKPLSSPAKKKADKSVVQEDGSQRVLMAQTDSPSHRKPLYQF